jgi:hypothetical protein
MNTEDKEAKGKSRRIWGWILTIIGGLSILWGIFFMLLAIFSIIFSKTLMDTVAFTIRDILLCAPGLLIGIPLLILGVMYLRSGK